MGSRFCRACGGALSVSNAETAVTPPPPTQPVAAAPSQPLGPLAQGPGDGVAPSSRKLKPAALVAVLAALILAGGGGAAITLVAAKGSGNGSHQAVVTVTTKTAAGTAPSTGPAHRPKAYDAAAEELARSAAIAAETFATDNNGSYAGITPEKLREIEPTIVACPASAEEACVSAQTSTANTYTVTAKAASTGDEFSIERGATGEPAYTCTPPTQAGDEGCVNGSWAAGTAPSTAPIHRPKAYDAAAKELARTGATSAETFATEHNGSYVGITPEKLRQIEPTIVVCPASAEEACLSAVTSTANTYKITAKAASTGDEFSIERNAAGELADTCAPPSQTGEEGCVNGSW